MPQIDQIVDVASIRDMFSFLNAFFLVQPNSNASTKFRKVVFITPKACIATT